MKENSRLSFFSQRRAIFAATAFVVSTLPLFAQSSPKAVYIPYRDAQPILNQLDEILPLELKGKTPAQQSAIWANWIANRDRDIRARLAQGDEDSLINF